ncbi:hypothetical protein HOO68_04740 [Candidatus Gracilibacteria bacterium]|nr:hypothetical protein [Candidatus Gracilibacteria bacterium]
MYPNIITDTGEYNVPYINKLLDLGTLDEDEFKRVFNDSDPECHHNYMQLLALGILIQSGSIQVTEYGDSLRIETDENNESISFTFYI